MSVDAKKFKGLIEEIEASEKRSKSEAEHRAAIFKRAKGDGLNPKLMRVIVRERRRNESERQKEQDELDTYRAALNAAVALVHNEGLSQREAARRSGVSKSSLNRALAVPAVSHDADGVITETADRKPPGDDTGTGETEGAPAPVVAITESCGGVESRHAQVREIAPDALQGSEPERVKPLATVAGTDPVKAGESTPVGQTHGLSSHLDGGETRQAGLAPGPQDPIDLTPPPHLDRRKVVA